MSEDVAQAPMDDEAPEQGAPDAKAPKTESGDKSSQPKSDGKSGGEAKEGGPAPWAKDLADRGLDDPRFDAYLNEVWQPRMTQFEQQVSQYNDMFGGDIERAQIMAGLAEALENDPVGTYQEIGRLLGLANDGEYDEFAGDEGEMPEYDDDDETGEQDEYRQWVMQKMEEEEIARQDQAYESLLTELDEAYPGFDRELFHAAIVAHDGNPEQALEWYMKYHKEPAPVEQHDGPTPLGEGNPTPPESKQYSGIGDAISDFLSEEKTRGAL